MKQIFFTILLFLFTVSAAFAQENINGDLSNKEQVRKPTDCGTTYKEWVKKDVAYIITSEEQKAFNDLKTDEERENFIENFWHRRDPDPDTEENEFREEYYERIKYANEHFESGIPGWKTDRGWIYILFGKPDEIKKDRKNFEDLKNVLFENWFYKRLDGIGSDVEFNFFDPTETKEFRLPKEKREEILRFSEPGLKVCYMCSKNPF